MAKILVVDDRVTDRGLLATLLKYAHHDVLEAVHGAQALQIVRAQHLDLVISDVLLPEMDGYEFVRQIRADPSTARTAVIFYTAVFNEFEAKGLAEACGVFRVLSKPTEPEKILEVVSEALRARGLEVISPVCPSFKDKHQQLLIAKLMQQVEELHQSEERLRAAHDELQDHALRLQETNKDLEQFAYTISHDLHAPLRAIKGFARMLAEDYGQFLEEEGNRRLAVIEANATKMGLLIDDLLAFSRAGRTEMRVARIDVNSLVAEVVETLKTSNAGVGADIHVSALPSIQGDPMLVRQVLANLLENAIKFSRSRPEPKIEVGNFEREGEQVYFVKDNGIGFDMKYYDRLFAVFQRLVSEKEFEGTGVGLAIAQRLISRHNGRIWAEGRLGEGATFFFTLKAEGPGA